jgi:RNAse (barnase) inhibitor barstar
MTGQLHSEGFDIERYYPQDLSELYDLLGAMILGQLEPETLKHQDCMDQLLKSSEGRFIMLFGGLNRIKDKLDQDAFGEMSRGICAAFYHLKWGQEKEYCLAIGQLEELLKTGVQRKKTANDV